MSKPFKSMQTMGNGDMLEDQHRDAYGRFAAEPGPKANAEILKHLAPTIDHAIRVHVGQSSPLLVSRARRMALDALRSYDPKRSRLQTHLFSQLQGLKRANRQLSTVVKVPERISIDRHHLERYTKDLTDELGREPTDTELADKTGFSPKRIAKVRTYAPAVAEGTLTSASDGNIYGPVDSLQKERLSWIHEAVYDDLSASDRKIMELTLGMNGRKAMSNQDIARKIGRSPGLVSQRKLHIQKKLDELAELRQGFL